MLLFLFFSPLFLIFLVFTGCKLEASLSRWDQSQSVAHLGSIHKRKDQFW